jgi:RHS repeat-associated protein
VDGANRRIGRSVNGVPAQGFLYQGQLRVVAELDGAGTVVSRFVYGTGVNVPNYMVRGGTTYRLVTDHLGSVRLVVDAATGAIAQQLDYDPFGRVVLDTNPGFQPFGFAGGLYDPLTGLVRFGARDYDAETGRWTRKEPLGFSSGETNLYRYAADDPLNLVDPLGLAVYPDDFVGPLAPGDLRMSQVGNIVFNETRSIFVEDESRRNHLQMARIAMARAIINGSDLFGVRRPQAASPDPPSRQVLRNPAEAAAYAACQAAARAAFTGFGTGAGDFLDGAVHFNLRPNSSTGPFFGMYDLRLQFGPFSNSFPTRQLPSSDIYINIYE